MPQSEGCGSPGLGGRVTRMYVVLKREPCEIDARLHARPDGVGSITLVEAFCRRWNPLAGTCGYTLGTVGLLLGRVFFPALEGRGEPGEMQMPVARQKIELQAAQA